MSRQEEKSALQKNEHIIKKASLVSQPLFFIGGAERDRTVDLMMPEWPMNIMTSIGCLVIKGLTK